MKVVILCGGRGTRLHQETEFRPKPMLPIGTQPILWHIMQSYASQGHREFILCLGYKGEIIKDYFRHYLWRHNDVTVCLGQEPRVQFHGAAIGNDWTVTLADTGENTKTAGRIKRVEKYLQGERDFLLTYGDGVGDVDVNAAIEFHRHHGAKLTLTAVRPPGRFGELQITKSNLVTQFNEKPQVTEGRINGGYFVASRELFDYLDEDNDEMLEESPLRRLAAEGELRAYRHDGFWQPMDTVLEFNLLNRLWAEGNAPWKTW